MDQPSIDAIITAGKLALAVPFSKETAELFGELLRPTAKQGGEKLSEWVGNFRLTNITNVLRQTAAKLAAAGVKARQVGTPFLLEAMDAAASVDDPTIQEMWANLLAAGVAADANQHPMYINILKQMNSEDAQMLSGLATSPPPPTVFEHGGVTMAFADGISHSRLKALGLIRNPLADNAGMIGTGLPGWALTPLGQDFYKIVGGQATATK
jgi:hypothetical protein